MVARPTLNDISREITRFPNASSGEIAHLIKCSVQTLEDVCRPHGGFVQVKRRLVAGGAPAESGTDRAAAASRSELVIKPRGAADMAAQAGHSEGPAAPGEAPMCAVVGHAYRARIIRVQPYGHIVALCDVPGRGLVHVSKMGKGFVAHAADVGKTGDEVWVVPMKIEDPEKIDLVSPEWWKQQFGITPEGWQPPEGDQVELPVSIANDKYLVTHVIDLHQVSGVLAVLTAKYPAMRCAQIILYPEQATYGDAAAAKEQAIRPEAAQDQPAGAKQQAKEADKREQGRQQTGVRRQPRKDRRHKHRKKR